MNQLALVSLLLALVPVRFNPSNTQEGMGIWRGEWGIGRHTFSTTLPHTLSSTHSHTLSIYTFSTTLPHKLSSTHSHTLSLSTHLTSPILSISHPFYRLNLPSLSSTLSFYYPLFLLPFLSSTLSFFYPLFLLPSLSSTLSFYCTHLCHDSRTLSIYPSQICPASIEQ